MSDNRDDRLCAACDDKRRRGTQSMGEPMFIDATPDGLFLAAFAVAEHLVALGYLEDKGCFPEIFAELTRQASTIDKSSWLPHNKKEDQS